MRRLNMFLVIGMLVTFLIHGIMGGLQLAGADMSPHKIVAWISLGFTAAHFLVTTILTIQTLRARKRAGAGYFKDNKLFWVRRISGFTILIPLILHLIIFKSGNADAYRLQVFTMGRLISQILLIASMALHVLTNIKPVMISLGVKGSGKVFIDILFIMSCMLLLFAAAFAIYYIRWMSY